MSAEQRSSPDNLHRKDGSCDSNIKGAPLVAHSGEGPIQSPPAHIQGLQWLCFTLSPLDICSSAAAEAICEVNSGSIQNQYKDMAGGVLVGLLQVCRMGA